MKAFIVGSGFYDFQNFNKKKVVTPYGEAEILYGNGENSTKDILILPRHGNGHHFLSNQINHLANIFALQQEGASSIISLSVVGALSSNVTLASPLIPDEIFFPENRLPNGSLCSIFQEAGKDRGHLLARSLLHSEIQKDILDIFPSAHNGGTYVHANGPRLNTKSEIKNFQNIGGTVISQTCGPEAVLANELEIPYSLLTFPIDYANGVTEVPTSPEELGENLSKSKEVFTKLIIELSEKKNQYAFQNFIYRFES